VKEAVRTVLLVLLLVGYRGVSGSSGSTLFYFCVLDKFMRITQIFLLFSFLCSSSVAIAQLNKSAYWNNNTQLLPWRMVPTVTDVSYTDLDKDGDPDVLKAFINDSVPIVWIDDDDDMKKGDWEGDTDSDCLLIDRNKDGVFAGPDDFSIDWCDEDKNGKADIQLIASNGGLKHRGYFDWKADFMYILDEDEDNIMHYVDWNRILMQAWEHNGHANFFYDYHGNSTFLKMHASTFRINDLRYNWENPFIFYDTDNDKLTEMAIRLVDSPRFRDADSTKNGFDKIDPTHDVLFTRNIDYAALAWDLDNDNGPSNEFDFDMSLLFKGKGFEYTDQVHRFRSLAGLPAANKYFYDARWRNLQELVFPDRNAAADLIFTRGDWKECRLIFDEDDDCNRWERVEFYDPKDPFIIGTGKGGLDHNKQADASGDRGEFDLDNSGKGKLYLGLFDGRIHLYGAEWGAWRIDQTTFSYQGFGGEYDRWNKGRIQIQPEKFATVKYADTDNNGFIDQIEYDLDGDKLFEEKISLIALGIDDKQALFETGTSAYNDFNKLFSRVAEQMWKRAVQAVELAAKLRISTNWYAFYKQPRSIQEKYDFGFWLNFYLYRDIKHIAAQTNNKALLSKIDRAYYSGDWSLVNSSMLQHPTKNKN
jgi:hypothetical protein